MRIAAPRYGNLHQQLLNKLSVGVPVRLPFRLGLIQRRLGVPDFPLGFQGRAGEDLQKAMEQRDASVVNDFELSYAKGDLAAAKTQLAQLELTIADSSWSAIRAL